MDELGRDRMRARKLSTQLNVPLLALLLWHTLLPFQKVTRLLAQALRPRKCKTSANTGVERNELYRMLRLEVTPTAEDSYKVEGAFCTSELLSGSLPRVESEESVHVALILLQRLGPEL